MKTWKLNPDDAPWFDRPNALELLEARRAQEQLGEEDYALLRRWVEEGYAVVPGVVGDDLIASMQRDLEDLWTAARPLEGLVIQGLKHAPDAAPVNLSHAELVSLEGARRFQMRDASNWRIPGFQRYSAGAGAISNHPELLRLTSLICGRPSSPAYTLNFMYGSEQSLHQDTTAFHVFPPNYLVGAWVACQDISPDSGPLAYYARSHREPLFHRFDNYPQTNFKTAPPGVVEEYKEYVERVSARYERSLFLARRGDVLLLHGMLLHGGTPINDRALTRRSYVVHYIPPGMDVWEEIEGPFNW